MINYYSNVENDGSVIDLVANVTSAYVAANMLSTSGLPSLISALHDVFTRLSTQPSLAAPSFADKPTPPLNKIVSHDSICCLECGRRFSSLMRHLSEAHHLSADAYRQKWRLPGGFPMISPALAKIRSHNTKSMGLGKRTKTGATP